jgi:hypothetical protein
MEKKRLRNKQWFCEYCELNQCLEKGKHCYADECEQAIEHGEYAINDVDEPWEEDMNEIITNEILGIPCDTNLEKKYGQIGIA